MTLCRPMYMYQNRVIRDSRRTRNCICLTKPVYYPQNKLDNIFKEAYRNMLQCVC